MTLNTWTKILIGGTFVVWIAWDVYVALNGAATESMILRDGAKRWNILPFIVGFLGAHWFLPKKKPSISGWMWALPIMTGLFVTDFIFFFGGYGNPWWRYPGLWFALGIPAGFYLWPQGDGDSPL